MRSGVGDDDFCLEHGRDFMRCDQGPIPYCEKCEDEQGCSEAERTATWRPIHKGGVEKGGINTLVSQVDTRPAPPSPSNLRPGPAHPMSEPWVIWQPIDMAPKDGTRILLSDGKFVGTGAWRERSGFRGTPARPEYYSECRWDIDGEQGDECPWANDYMGAVVAWMPLPLPPVAGIGAP